ncbi:MAG: NUDIX hydrolase [Alphaproteobacteria bacterium]|nr:NUDIX hydrolase [Alphaproteobacteria bacterium]
MAFRIAALRETFEECGILLAAAGPGAALVDGAAVSAWTAERARLARGEISFRAFLAERGLEPALDQLVPFAHWITPKNRPLRFDTRFFIAAAPVGQQADHDGTELTEALWVTPAEALGHADAGRWSLMLPTRLNLMRLAESASTARAIAAAARRPVVTVLPWTERRAGRLVRCIPAEAGYGITEMPVDEAEGTRKGETA